MKDFDLNQVAGMIDISAVRTDVTMTELLNMANLAKYYRFICAYAMPCFTPDLIELMADTPDVSVGGVVGFPSGADSTLIKVMTTRDMLAMGCSELDMVINVGALKSGKHDLVADDIKKVIDAAQGKTVKAILEIAYLTQDEIKRACEIAAASGVDYVKTGTGWAHKPTTVEDVKLIKRTIGNAVKIKVAGGVRTLDIMLEMIDAGSSRFGIGYLSAMAIMREVDCRLDRPSYCEAEAI